MKLRSQVVINGLLIGVDRAAYGATLYDGSTIVVCVMDLNITSFNRNCVFSGLAVGTLVVEIARRIGNLITSSQAAEHGRDVSTVPGSIYSPFSSGPHALLRDGEKLGETAPNISKELGVAAPQSGTGDNFGTTGTIAWKH